MPLREEGASAKFPLAIKLISNTVVISVFFIFGLCTGMKMYHMLSNELVFQRRLEAFQHFYIAELYQSLQFRQKTNQKLQLTYCH